MHRPVLLAALLCAAAAVPAAGQTPRPPAPPPAAPAPDAALLERARRLHRQTPLVDGHNDLPWALREHRAMDLRLSPDGPLEGFHTDVPRLRAGGVGGVFWAAYVPHEATRTGAARVALEQIDLIHRMIDASPALELALTADDVVRIHGEGRIASLIGIEGGHAIERSLGTLRQFHALGARYLTLTHGTTIEWADAATDAPRHGGLSAFGVEVVREMNRLGMLVDLSHVSAEAMHDALDASAAPVLFSHSSARAVADHPRNVPDDVLARLPENGGLVMVNFSSAFIDPRGAAAMRDMFAVRRRLEAEHPDDPAAAQAAYDAWRAANPVPRGTVAQVADHIEHIVRVAGIDHVGYGSDFDGVSSVPEGLDDVSFYPHLTAELLRRGHSDADVRKVLGENLLRVMREAEAVSVRLRAERPASTRTHDELDGGLVRRP